VIVFIAALRRELAPLRGLLAIEGEEQVGDVVFTEGSSEGVDVALVQSGMGRERSETATRRAIARYRPEVIVSIGYSGGLAPEVRGGDLLLAERVLAATEEELASGAPFASPPLKADQWLLDAASIALEEWLLQARRGDLVSVPAVMPGAREKERLSRLCSADMVDMETYWVGRVAKEARIPFLAARVASDEVGDSLPDYERFMTPMGDLRPLQAAWYFVIHPIHIVTAPMLASSARRGARNLAAFAALFLTMVHRAAPVR
jgi:adenosylhomocysteine nucleosidase